MTLEFKFCKSHYFSISKACKELSVSSTFVMLSSILDDIKGERCRQGSTRMRGVDKYKGNCVFKVNEEGKYKVIG